MPLLGKFGTATSRTWGFTGGGVVPVPVPVPPGNIFNYDVYANRGPTYIPGIANIVVTIPASTTVGSTSTGAYAISVPSAFSPTDTVTIVNNGVILGMGGSGGAGTGGSGPVTVGSPGTPGGNAVYVNRPTTITNNGVIAGGGGGGGGGGRQSAKFTGGTGGGGAGLNGGAPNGTPTAGGAGTPGAYPGGNSPGGAGGGRGSAGAAGYPPGGSGGGAGNYITGNPFVTWPATGTRLGGVA